MYDRHGSFLAIRRADAYGSSSRQPWRPCVEGQQHCNFLFILFILHIGGKLFSSFVAEHRNTLGSRLRSDSKSTKSNFVQLVLYQYFPAFDLVISRKMYSHRYLMFVWACGTLIFNWLPVRFRVTISGYLTHIRRCHEYNFTYSIGKLCFPSESISVYWKCRAKSPPLPFFFGAKVQERQNRKLGKLYSTVSLEM